MEENEVKRGSVPIYEQETTISYARDEKGAFIWTSDSTVMTKLDRLCRESPDNYTCTETAKDQDGCQVSKSYYIKDKRLLSFRSSRQKREYTEEQLVELRERLRSMREKQAQEN